MWANHLMIQLIHFYQRFSHHPKARRLCRCYPSCSHYAEECFKRFNFFKAFLLSIKRILHCNRFSPYRVDPVPLNFVQKNTVATMNLLNPAIKNEY